MTIGWTALPHADTRAGLDDRSFHLISAGLLTLALIGVGVTTTALIMLANRRVAAYRQLIREANLAQAKMEAAQGLVDLRYWSVDAACDAVLWPDAPSLADGPVQQAAGPGLETAFAGLLPDDLPAVRAACTRTLQEGAVFDQEYRIRRGDGAIRWMRAVAHAQPQPNGPTSIVGVVQDITDARALREELREKNAALLCNQLRLEQTNADLQSKAAEMTELAQKLDAALVKEKAATQEAQAASQAKSDFLAMMSHELRTPLNAILGFAEVMRDGHCGTDLDRFRGYAGYIHEAGEHLLALISDILDLAKLESGRVELQPIEMDVTDLFTRARELTSGLAEAARVELSVDTVMPGLSLLADRRATMQMLFNLLSNAIKFTPAEGKVRVKLDLPAEGGVVIAVEDTGIGMTESGIKRALERFTQVEPLDRRSQHGTGLGLPLVKELIELHGGTLELRSEPNQGTQARLCFPGSALRYQQPLFTSAAE